MWLTRLDLQIGWLLFCEWLKDFWKPFADIPEDRLLVPGYSQGYVK